MTDHLCGLNSRLTRLAVCQAGVSFVTSVALAVKLEHSAKTLLRRAVALLQPAATIRRRKHAFQVPLAELVARSLRGFVRETLVDRHARQRGWFVHEQAEKLLSPDAVRGVSYGQSGWTLLCLELWARSFLGGHSGR